jgi:hypothetical protein
MSGDEFDTDIERLFSRSPQLADAETFAKEVESRLRSGSKVRALALMIAGLIGGVLAIQQSLNLNFKLYSSPPSTGVIGQGLQSATGEATVVLANISDFVGLSSSAFGSMGALQLFWVASATLVAMIAAGIMKLSEEA